MGKIKLPEKVKLICGIIFNKNFFSMQEYPLEPEIKLQELFGKIDLRSKIIKFDFTNYYNNEMGEYLMRYWISFEKLLLPEEIVFIKNKTNEIEIEFSVNNKRKINIDPGYISDAQLVLASTKNYSHRIYLNNGIYAEVTLIYKNSKFEILPWTYPDYKIKISHEFFKQVREKYFGDLRDSITQL